MKSLFDPKLIQLSRELSQKLTITDAAFEKDTKFQTAPRFEGRKKQKKSGIGDDFLQYRPFQTSENSSLIDWRASAKSDSLQVKEKEVHSKNRIYIWLDLRPSMFIISDKKALSKAQIAFIVSLAISQAARRQQIEIKPYFRSGKSFEDSIVSGDDREPDFPVPAAAVFFTDCMRETDEVCLFMERIADKTYPKILAIINDLNEIEFDYSDRINFSNPESHASVLIEDCEAIKSEYNAEIQNHFSTIETKAKQLSIDVQRISNDENYGIFAQAILNAIFRGF